MEVKLFWLWSRCGVVSTVRFAGKSLITWYNFFLPHRVLRRLSWWIDKLIYSRWTCSMHGSNWIIGESRLLAERFYYGPNLRLDRPHTQRCTGNLVQGLGMTPRPSVGGKESDQRIQLRTWFNWDRVRSQWTIAKPKWAKRAKVKTWWISGLPISVLCRAKKQMECQFNRQGAGALRFYPLPTTWFYTLKEDIPCIRTPPHSVPIRRKSMDDVENWRWRLFDLEIFNPEARKILYDVTMF